MFKVFPDNTKIESQMEIHRQYPSCGYLIKNPIDQSLTDGTILPCKGILHAICDKDGIKEMGTEIRRLQDNDVQILVDFNYIYVDDEICIEE